MEYIFFMLKLGTRFSDLDANFIVSTPFNKSEVIEDIIRKLSEINYSLDLESLKFVIRDNQLYAEGLAYEEEPPTEFNYCFLEP